MRVTLHQKNLEITPVLRTYIDAKLIKPVEKLLQNITTELPLLELELSRTTVHHRKGRVYRAEANLSLGRFLFRAEVEDADIRSACDTLEEELKKEITRFKTKYQSRELRRAREVKKNLRLAPAARTYRKGRILNEGS